MLMPDVNILVYAFRAELPDHERYRQWLEDVINGDQPYSLADLVLSGFVRVVTHPRIFRPPAPLETALAFAERIRAQPQCAVVAPGRRHWEIFTALCRAAGATGNLVPDAYFAAMAVESGNEWITTDRDYGRFPGLRWRAPW